MVWGVLVPARRPDAQRGSDGNGRGEEGDQPLRVRMWRTVRRYLPGGMEAAGLGVAIVVVLSVGAAIEPGDDLLTALGSGLGYETYADLTDDDISTKPSGWTGREETAAVEIAQVKGADLEGRDLRNADASGAFLVKAKLAGADLRGADLSGADLRDADLSGADLSARPTSQPRRRPPRRRPQRRRPPRRQPPRRRPQRRRPLGADLRGQPQRRRPPRRRPQRRRPQRRRPPRRRPPRRPRSDPGAARWGLRRRQDPAAPRSNDQDVPGHSATRLALAADWIVLTSPRPAWCRAAAGLTLTSSPSTETPLRVCHTRVGRWMGGNRTE